MLRKGWWWIPWKTVKVAEKSANSIKINNGPPKSQLLSTQQSWRSQIPAVFVVYTLENKLMHKILLNSRGLRTFSGLLRFTGVIILPTQTSCNIIRGFSSKWPYVCIVSSRQIRKFNDPWFSKWIQWSLWSSPNSSLLNSIPGVMTYNRRLWPMTSEETYLHHFRKIQKNTTPATIYLNY